MLSQARSHATLPASDLQRARRFYEEVLGFSAERVLPGGVMYSTADGTRFLVFPSSGKASGAHTQIGLVVTDIDAEVTALKSQGVEFEAYDMPQFDTSTSIATFPANRSAWFRDSEGNLLGIVQFLE